MKQPLLLRADAGPEMGTGHVMRSIALAQAWRRKCGRVVLCAARLSPEIRERVEAVDIEVRSIEAVPGSAEDARATGAAARETGAKWVAADGYRFGGEFQRRCRAGGTHLLIIDDNGEIGHYECELVLNQNIHARPRMYSDRGPHTKLLLGTRYTLLREEFLKREEPDREVPALASRILATLGGSDPADATSLVIQSMAHLSGAGMEAVVLVGGANPRIKKLQALADRCPAPIRLERNVTDIPDKMAWADLTVCAAGSTCWELAFMGVPAAMFVIAENQLGIAEALQRQGCAINLGWPEQVQEEDLAGLVQQLARDTDARKRMQRKGRKLVDGRGAVRAVKAMLEWSDEGADTGAA